MARDVYRTTDSLCAPLTPSMTTLWPKPKVLRAGKKPLGEVVSELARQSLRPLPPSAKSRGGVPLIPVTTNRVCGVARCRRRCPTHTVCYRRSSPNRPSKVQKLPGGQTPVGDCCIPLRGRGLRSACDVVIGKDKMLKSSAGAVFKVFSGQEALQRLGSQKFYDGCL